jgi:SRSO17 transposase
MGLRERKSIESRFGGYVEGLVGVIGHADRAGPLRDYCTGLVAASGRKSVEPTAAITAPERMPAQHPKATATNSLAADGGYYIRNWQEMAKTTECKGKTSLFASRPR